MAEKPGGSMGEEKIEKEKTVRHKQFKMNPSVCVLQL